VISKPGREKGKEGRETPKVCEGTASLQKTRPGGKAKQKKNKAKNLETVHVPVVVRKWRRGNVNWFFGGRPRSGGGHRIPKLLKNHASRGLVGQQGFQKKGYGKKTKGKKKTQGGKADEG